MNGDTFDPKSVYLVGTLQSSSCGYDAIAHVSTPNVAAAGFYCFFDNIFSTIRPSDGRLLYVNGFEGVLREFECDACPITSKDAYPPQPLANDPMLSEKLCLGSTILRVLIAPDGGVIHNCTSNSNIWLQDDSVVYDDAGDPLVYLGGGGLALTVGHVVDLATEVATPIVGLSPGAPLTIRADPVDGFLMVLGGQPPELWHVPASGVAVSLGKYPPLPNGYLGSLGGRVLDGCQTLLEFGNDARSLERVIIRRTLAGASEVIYTEASEPLVKLHASTLVTGP